jgi:chemotaxis protein histidine kinase CheA
MNARNLKNYNRAVARGQAKFAAAAKSNKAKAALAAARIKLQAAVNKINEKHTKKRAAAFNKKELRAKKQMKNKELKLKAALKKKQSESRQKEKNHKANKAAEADLKYKKKAAKAAAMEKDAKKAKAAAAASVKAAEAATAAAKVAEATQASWDAGIKECNSSTECLLNGKKCQKTGKKTGWYLDQVGFVKCVKTKPQNMIGDWAGTPFSEKSFPEATYHEPKFVMPVMPGFTWKISNHFEKVKAKIKAGIKKASKHDTK